MIIDFHTHMFPDKIAKRTIEALAGVNDMEPFTDGTMEGLKKSTKDAGIDLAIALPIATKPTQFLSIHEYAKQFRSGNILSFGTIHPDSVDYKAELRTVKEMGFLGIKLHPDYQDTYFNDIKYKRIVSYATELGLIVTVHAGVDPKCADDVHCTPHMARELIDEVQPEKLIMAHLGGHLMTEESWEELVGQDIYFDTGVMLDLLSEDELVKIIRAIGVDRVLFASDTPWASQKKFVEIMKKLPFSADEKEKIFCKNAVSLLGRENLQEFIHV